MTTSVGLASRQRRLATAKMLTSCRGLSMTCRRRHAATDAPTALRLLPTSRGFTCRVADAGLMSGRLRYTAAEMPPMVARHLPTLNSIACRHANVVPMSGRRKNAAVGILTSSRCPSTSGRLRHVYWVVTSAKYIMNYVHI